MIELTSLRFSSLDVKQRELKKFFFQKKLASFCSTGSLTCQEECNMQLHNQEGAGMPMRRANKALHRISCFRNESTLSNLIAEYDTRHVGRQNNEIFLHYNRFHFPEINCIVSSSNMAYV